jgi:hypothetical protein
MERPGKDRTRRDCPPGSFLAASQQFGLNQTDVFLVDNSRSLDVFWVHNAGAWNGPGKIGPAGPLPPGGAIAVSQQFGLNQTDVFLTDGQGVVVFWVDDAGAWQGPETIGDSDVGFAINSPIAVSQQFGLNQTDVFLLDQNGQLNVFWVDNAGAWQGPEKIGPADFSTPFWPYWIAASQQFGLSQTDVFLVDNQGYLDVFWVDNAGAWQGPGRISQILGEPFIAASHQFGLNQTDVFGIDAYGYLDVFWVDNAGAWSSGFIYKFFY